MHHYISVMLTLIMVALPSAANAALTRVTNPADFPAAATSTSDLAGLADGAVTSTTLFADTPFESRFSALSGDLFVNGGILSTNIDEDAVVIDFPTPVIGFGFSGGVVNEPFAFVDGEFAIAVGSDTETFSSTAGVVSFAGVLSDTPFTRAVVRVVSFDLDETSVAFVGLDTASTVVPVPAALPLLASGVAALVYLRSRRKRHL